MSAIGTFSTYGIDGISLVNSTTLTCHSYFRDLSCVTCEYKLPAASTNQTSKEKAVGKGRLERVFTGAAFSIVKPTAICALLKFKGLCSICSTKFCLAHPKLSIRAFVKGCKERPIFSWNMILPLTLAYCLKYTGIVESYYVSKEVDK